MPGPALVVGLGNPGPEYEHTRHNLGYLVVDVLAADIGVRVRPVKGVRAFAGDGHWQGARLILAKPTTYMNLSGEAVAELARYHKVDVEDIVIVHDDLDLPLGTIKIKRGGGDGGHNGLKHITRALRTAEYVRVRLGIGRPPGRAGAADFVLKPFAKSERTAAELLVQEGAEAVTLVLRDGIEAAQRRFHASESNGPDLVRAVVKEAIVPASLPEVWRAFATVEGVTSFLAPDAVVEPTRGGVYDLTVDPETHSHGSVLAVEPERLIVFSWTAWPAGADPRARRTRVEVKLRPEGSDTRVTISHTGWKQGAEFDEAMAMAERLWGATLLRLQSLFPSA